jgi:hypothetical protein
MAELGIGDELNGKLGKRVTLRMVVTIASTLSQPAVRESGVMRLPQTIPGLFDLVPKKRIAKHDSVQPPEAVLEAPSDGDAD